MKIDGSLVSRLITLQFPQWACLPINSVKEDGHDNRTFHLGHERSVRMPSSRRYAEHVGIEHEWLPRIAPHLPLPIPEPVGRGVPGSGYPWRWTINRWIEGDTASIEGIGNLDEFAKNLAGFLNVLQDTDATGAPPPGQANFYRGGDLSVYDAQTRNSIKTLGPVLDGDRAASMWERALNARAVGSPVWVHGDIAPGNLLLRGGKLCAVIDFGQLATGDPSCDLAIAWSFLTGSGRRCFREALRIDDATWIRGQGWALWKALITLVQHEGSDHPDGSNAMRTIEEIFNDED